VLPVPPLLILKHKETNMSKSINPRLTLTTFRPNYSPRHNPRMPHSPDLSGSPKLKLPEGRSTGDSGHHPASKLQRPSQGLSWSVLKIPNGQCSKSVVRNWAARRVRAAFEEALREEGLRWDGTVLVKKGEGKERQDVEEDGAGEMSGDGEGRTIEQQHNTPKQAVRTISGSLLLRVEAATVTASKETLDKDAETVVKWLLKQQQGPDRAERMPNRSRLAIRHVG
jgi:hypothetical protein